jgi:signal transduction histidine kinase
VTQPGIPAILLVDDQGANLVAMSALLEVLGHPVVKASSGVEAIAKLDEHHVGLILMDVQMPGLDGFAAVARIREQKRWSHIPVVFLTAIHDDPDHEARGYALGAVDYVAKPFNANVLIAKLRALMEWHERTESLKREAEELAQERATRAERERILGIVSHDLRSPLATVGAGAAYLLASGLGGKQAEACHRIQRNVDRMARLISDLLDYSRLQAGSLAIRPAASSVAKLVTDLVEDIQLTCPRRIEVVVRTERNALVDRDRLAQAISNLVHNAVQHSSQSARIAVVLRDVEDSVEISVWNEGDLKQPDPAALFEPFQRGDHSTGMGLGLYIAQQIARAHGGEIAVSSAPGAGTAFRLTLPVTASPSRVESGQREAIAVGAGLRAE